MTSCRDRWALILGLHEGTFTARAVAHLPSHSREHPLDRNYVRAQWATTVLAGSF